MGLNQLFNRELVFCLDVANQEELFDQVATLLEERQIVTDSYRAALKEREIVPYWLRYGISRKGSSECSDSSYGYRP